MEIYEVHVSAEHWAEGCDKDGLRTWRKTQSCPVYRAMAEAGLPVSSVNNKYWNSGAYEEVPHNLPEEAGWAINEFDSGHTPEPLTFYVSLP